MEITKYPQSCLLIEKNSKNILVDPGNFTAQKYNVSDFPEIDAIFLTHRHPDHVDEALIKGFLSRKDIPVVANADTKAAFPDLVTQLMIDKEELEVAGIRVEARDLPHVLMVDGSAGPPNTEYVFDGVFFHPGDGVEINNLKVRTVAAPIAGPDLSLYDAYNFIANTGAEQVIPIHYSIFSDDKPAFATTLLAQPLPEVDIIVLENGTSVLL